MKKIKIFKKKKKIDKNTIYAYILLVFFVFWTIGGVFGFIAFGKQKKESNVVSASANVVDDFSSTGIINLQDAFLKGSFYPLNTNNRVICDSTLYTNPNGEIVNGYSLYIDINDGALYNTSHQVLVSLDWLCSSLEDGKSYMLSFVVEFYDFEYYTYPSFNFMESYDGEIIDSVNFTVDMFRYGHFLYTVNMTYDETSDYFIGLFTGNSYLSGRNSFDLELFNPAIYSYFNFGNGVYVYTEQELQYIYEQAIIDAYNNGLLDNNANDYIYNLGYSQAIDDISNAMAGVLEHSQLKFKVNDRTYQGVTTQGFTVDGVQFFYNNNDSVDFVKVIENVFSSQELDMDAYDYNVCEFLFSIDEDYLFNPNFLQFTMSHTFVAEGEEDLVTTWLIDDRGSRYYGSYYSNGYDSAIVYDLSTFPTGHKIVGFGFSLSIYMYFNGGYVLYDQGADYAAGYLAGNTIGYNQALQNYQSELDNSYNIGYNQGKKVGYNEGYDKGVNDSNDYTFTRLISSVVDVPIRAFTSLFNFEILGINLANFFFALLTICLVLAIIKLVI